MPWGVALFLVYALALLAGVGLSLGFIVEQAVLVPDHAPGLVVDGPPRLHDLHGDPRAPAQGRGARTSRWASPTLALPAIPLALLWRPADPRALRRRARPSCCYRGLRAPLPARGWTRLAAPWAVPHPRVDLADCTADLPSRPTRLLLDHAPAPPEPPAPGPCRRPRRRAAAQQTRSSNATGPGSSGWPAAARLRGPARGPGLP